MCMNSNPLYTLNEAGEYTNTSERFMRRLVAERRIDVIRLGKHVRISKEVLDEWIKKSTESLLTK